MIEPPPEPPPLAAMRASAIEAACAWSTYCECVWLPGAAVVAVVPSVRFEVPLPVPAPMSWRTSCAVTEPRICRARARSEEHTSELQSRENLVCRLLLEKKYE